MPHLTLALDSDRAFAAGDFADFRKAVDEGNRLAIFAVVMGADSAEWCVYMPDAATISGRVTPETLKTLKGAAR